MTVKVIYKEEDWEALATCIKTEQVPAADIVSIFNDNPEFQTWYKKEYINDDD
jgi:hypothetical protein